MTNTSWERDVYRPVLVVVTSGSLIASLTWILASRLPSWPIILGHPVILFFICIESYAATRFAHSCRLYRLGFHLKEWLVMAILLRAGILLIFGLPEIDFEKGILAAVESILGAWLFQPAFMLNLALLYIAWRLANLFSKDFLALDLVPEAAESRRLEFEKAQFVSGQDFYQRVWARYAKGALLAVTALGLSWRFGPLEDEGLRSASSLAILYLASGWLLVSQAFFLHLKLDWLKDRIAPPASLVAGFAGQALAITGFLTAVALTLPVVRWPFSLGGAANWVASLVGRLFRFLESLAGPESLSTFANRRLARPGGQGVYRFPDISIYIYVLALALLLLILSLLAYLAFKRGTAQPEKTTSKRALADTLASFKLVRQMFYELFVQLLSFPGFVLFLLRELARWLGRAEPKTDGHTKTQGEEKPSLRGKGGVVSFYHVFLKCLKDKGIRLEASMTPYEIAEAAIGWYQAYAQDIMKVTEPFVRWRYGRKALGKEEMKAARRSLRRFKAASRVDKPVGLC